MKLRKLTALVLSLLLIFSLCACGSSSTASSRKEANYAASAPAAMYDAAYEAGESYMPEPMPAEQAAFGVSNGSAAKPESQESAPETNPEKIIYSADATVETTEFDKSIAAAASWSPAPSTAATTMTARGATSPAAPPTTPCASRARSSPA